ncbi:PREDICTED: putative mediator of RNA polymerase II transcription subunit 26 [Priapulus caudatus]|uniref:Mediator of RNA polymerase II transcription subunit 26 n=1 Tax=Priapulus caudatus TaxID=37621 RepID=A0ABM1EZN7_PRICU|nr:PREDICTED: putative mediator of RNA polymerase II transcription subunit 26 [Priapulus caudatus]
MSNPGGSISNYGSVAEAARDHTSPSNEIDAYPGIKYAHQTRRGYNDHHQAAAHSAYSDHLASNQQYEQRRYHDNERPPMRQDVHAAAFRREPLPDSYSIRSLPPGNGYGRGVPSAGDHLGSYPRKQPVYTHDVAIHGAPYRGSDEAYNDDVGDSYYRQGDSQEQAAYSRGQAELTGWQQQQQQQQQKQQQLLQLLKQQHEQQQQQQQQLPQQQWHQQHQQQQEQQQQQNYRQQQQHHPQQQQQHREDYLDQNPQQQHQQHQHQQHHQQLPQQQQQQQGEELHPKYPHQLSQQQQYHQQQQYQHQQQQQQHEENDEEEVKEEKEEEKKNVGARPPVSSDTDRTIGDAAYKVLALAHVVISGVGDGEQRISASQNNASTSNMAADAAAPKTRTVTSQPAPSSGDIWVKALNADAGMSSPPGGSTIPDVNAGHPVPNIVHFVRFNEPEVTFVQMLCMQAALQYIRPDRLYVHTDRPPSGRYWNMIRENPAVVVRHVTRPRRAHGRKLSAENALLFVRVAALREHGGISLADDILVVNSLDAYRKYEFTLGWPEGRYVSTSVLMATRDAAFLRVLEAAFTLGDEVTSHLRQQLTTRVLWLRPDLVHGVPTRLGVHNVCYDVFYGPLDWQDYDAVDLMYAHRYYLTPEDPIQQHDENNIKHLATPFGEIARLLYYGTRDVIK